MLPWSRHTVFLGRRTFSTVTRHNPVIYHDKAIVVLNKPPGVVSQPVPGVAQQSGAVLGLLDEYRRTQDPSPIWSCHRIDKPTTGAFICAKSRQTARDLAQQFEARTVEKTYLALLRGDPNREGGVVANALALRDGSVCLARAEDKERLEAVTEWEKLGTSPFAPVSLVKFVPKTGRKHQLRVHASYVLHAPILGDENHVRTRVSPQITKHVRLPRDTLYLHAAFISFHRYRPEGPSKRFRLGIGAPLQPHFVDACKKLRIRIPEEYFTGGVYIDGIRIEGGAVPEIGGQWLA